MNLSSISVSVDMIPSSSDYENKIRGMTNEEGVDRVGYPLWRGRRRHANRVRARGQDGDKEKEEENLPGLRYDYAAMSDHLRRQTGCVR